MTTKEIMQKAIGTYGLQNQMIKTVEELSELIQALSKAYSHLCSDNSDLKSVDNLFEEMADVEIMLAQCKMMFHCEKEIQDWKDMKMARLKSRLEGQE